jgi:hypothetical protein
MPLAIGYLPEYSDVLICWTGYKAQRSAEFLEE